MHDFVLTRTFRMKTIFHAQLLFAESTIVKMTFSYCQPPHKKKLAKYDFPGNDYMLIAHLADERLTQFIPFSSKWYTFSSSFIPHLRYTDERVVLAIL